MLTPSALKDKINLCGRCTMHDDKINMDWVGAGMEFSFCGDYLRIFFETNAEKINIPLYIYSEIDGIGHKTAVSRSDEVLAIDLPEFKTHTFRLLRITEVKSPINDVSDYLFVTGIDLGRNGKLLNLPKKEKIIDFYGDSITNGWASLADPQSEERRQCDNDYCVSYAYLTANELNADARICAVSGHGIVSDCHGDRSEPMKLFYDMESRYLPIKMSFDKKADIIVSALGTNDCAANVSDTEMRDGIKEFISLIRKDSPDTHIVWMYGMMNTSYIPMMTKLFDELKDRNISFLPIEPVRASLNETGAFGHPNRKGERRIADALISHIKSVLNID